MLFLEFLLYTYQGHGMPDNVLRPLCRIHNVLLKLPRLDTIGQIVKQATQNVQPDTPQAPLLLLLLYLSILPMHRKHHA